MKPVEILKEVRALLSDDDILISDVGKHKMEIARHYPAYQPNTVLISNGFCSMSGGLSGAIGAWLAMPEKKILAIVGDGGFQMAMSEMETATRIGANITVQVWCDNCFGLIAWKQKLLYNKHTDLSFNNPDFRMLAEAFGWLYTDDLEEALNHEGPALVTQPVEYE